MGDFTPEWLALREPLDARSRAQALAVAVAGLAGAPGARERGLTVIDLGAGTGANLRHAAPRLGGRQEWLLVERDPRLLGAMHGCMRDWAAASGAGFEEVGERLVVRGAQYQCTIRSACLDLATQLDALAVPHGALVCASALLDLVSESWLRALARHIAERDAVAWFVLSYDGRIECEPPEAEDAVVRELFNLHQRTDKGFGPALGPEAGVAAMRIFAECGCGIRCAPSDWELAPGDRTLQHALLEGWFRAAVQIDAGQEPALRGWLARRRAQVEAGRSKLRVGHVDVLAAPAACDWGTLR
ncbi:MAG TPA: hypothetical protein VMB48_00635 [Steroidobacteraceae bacterium]|nr:hypothetical protein [Steroidobacteraceae bacterium]